MVMENLALPSILNCRLIKPNLMTKPGKEEEGTLFCFHGMFGYATLCGAEVISYFRTPAGAVLFAFLRKGKCLESWKPSSTQILFLNNISGRVCLKYSSNVKSCTRTEFNSISHILFVSKGTGIKGKKRGDPCSLKTFIPTFTQECVVFLIMAEPRLGQLCQSLKYLQLGFIFSQDLRETELLSLQRCSNTARAVVLEQKLRHSF